MNFELRRGEEGHLLSGDAEEFPLGKLEAGVGDEGAALEAFDVDEVVGEGAEDEALLAGNGLGDGVGVGVRPGNGWLGRRRGRDGSGRLGVRLRVRAGRKRRLGDGHFGRTVPADPVAAGGERGGYHDDEAEAMSARGLHAGKTALKSEVGKR